MRGELLRSTPLRVALLLSGIFLVSLAVASITAYQLIGRELAARVDRTLTDTFAVISQSYGDSDIVDLIASVESHTRTTLRHDQLFRLTDAKGKVLAGNLGLAKVPSGWSTQSSAALMIAEPFAFRLFSGPVGNNTLLVGESSEQRDEIGGLTVAAFGWAAAIFTGLVVAAGLFVAIRAQRRLDGIASTMRRIGQGELGARIPVGKRRDDIAVLSRQVNAALNRLSALVEGMRQVSVDIAHDLKTPLNRLAITVESAIDAEREGSKVEDLLAQAQEEGRQINATFDALLRIAQIEAGARRSRFALLQLEPILESIAEIYSEVAVERDQTLRLLPLPEPMAPINGDRELLTQLFANLVENALRHSPKGVAVTLSVEHTLRHAVVRIADSGPGIPAAEREKVFQRLYRLDKGRSTPGSGLGLSLVKAIADLHGASIELADNAPGLVVVLQFPDASSSRE